MRPKNSGNQNDQKSGRPSIDLACALLKGGSAKYVHKRVEGRRGSKKAEKLRAHYMDGPYCCFQSFTQKKINEIENFN